jgi:hypothetical protein
MLVWNHRSRHALVSLRRYATGVADAGSMNIVFNDGAGSKNNRQLKGSCEMRGDSRLDLGKWFMASFLLFM